MPSDIRFGGLTPLPQDNPWAKVATAVQQWQPQPRERQVVDPQTLNIRWLLRQLLLGQNLG